MSMSRLWNTAIRFLCVQPASSVVRQSSQVVRPKAIVASSKDVSAAVRALQTSSAELSGIKPPGLPYLSLLAPAISSSPITLPPMPGMMLPRIQADGSHFSFKCSQYILIWDTIWKGIWIIHAVIFTISLTLAPAAELWLLEQ